LAIGSKGCWCSWTTPSMNPGRPYSRNSALLLDTTSKDGCVVVVADMFRLQNLFTDDSGCWGQGIRQDGQVGCRFQFQNPGRRYDKALNAVAMGNFVVTSNSQPRQFLTCFQGSVAGECGVCYLMTRTRRRESYDFPYCWHHSMRQI
jgi:hypothetical protein